MEKEGPITIILGIIFTLLGIIGGALYLYDIGAAGIITWTAICVAISFVVFALLWVISKMRNLK
jgi:hypothetical protein